MFRLATIGLLILLPLTVSGAAAWGQPTTTGSVGCAAIVQGAANGLTSRTQADDITVQAPASVISMTCLNNFFSGVGLNLVTSLLNPATLLSTVQGKICSLVKSTWTSMLGGAQCGLTITGFNLGFGGIGGGLSCPKLSFGGGGPPIGSVGLGVGSVSGLYIPGSGMGPTGYTVTGVPPGSF